MRMKTFIRAMLAVAVVAIAMACSADADHMYKVGVSADTASESYVAYKASGAEAKVQAEVGKVATQIDNSDFFVVNGKSGNCDNIITTAVNTAMDEIEAATDYNKHYYLSGVTVVVMARDDEAILTRTFKK